MKDDRKTVFGALGRHPIHPFPARMAPNIALAALAEANKPMRVLDPMMGSGTVLAFARASGHHAVGFDLDPLAVLLARVWTTAIDSTELICAGERVLARAKLTFDELTHASAYPPNCSEETKKFLRYWFDDYSRQQLTALALVISRVRREPIREALWCAFSRLIITKSAGASLAMDLSHSRPHKKFGRAPTKPFSNFPAAVSIVGRNCVSSGVINRGPATRARLGDARSLKIPNESIDLVLTSPPYLNAIDYMRCSKFSLVWMGHNVEEIRDTRANSVGSELSLAPSEQIDAVATIINELRLNPQLDSRRTGMLSRYIGDMYAALSEVSRVLVRRGRATYVVGDSTIRGTFVANSEIVRRVAELSNLRLISRHSRNLPANRRYLPPPNGASLSATLDSRMRKEVVLAFQK